MDVKTSAKRLNGLSLADVRNALSSVYTLIIVLILWEVIGQLGVIHYHFLPPLSDIFRTAYELTASNRILTDSYLTIRRAIIGLLIAMLLGVPIGVMSGWHRWMGWFWNPIYALGYPVPVIALIPVFILWFGIGDLSKIILVALGCFWPIAINARNAAANVDQTLIWVAEMTGATRAQIFRKVVVPAATPGIVTGVQIALPISLIIAFVFEMVAGGGGLGQLQMLGVRAFQPTEVWAALFAIMVIGLVFDRGMRYARDKLLAWT